jgi:hypothetical protein
MERSLEMSFEKPLRTGRAMQEKSWIILGMILGIAPRECAGGMCRND